MFALSMIKTFSGNSRAPSKSPNSSAAHFSKCAALAAGRRRAAGTRRRDAPRYRTKKSVMHPQHADLLNSFAFWGTKNQYSHD
jgi:hypothetical protein